MDKHISHMSMTVSDLAVIFIFGLKSLNKMFIIYCNSGSYAHIHIIMTLIQILTITFNVASYFNSSSPKQLPVTKGFC